MLRRMPKPHWVVASTFLIAVFSFSAPSTGIKGKVLGEALNPLEEVNITITSAEYPAQKLRLKTNKKGEFIQIGLEPGMYSVQCEKEGYVPEKKEVRVHLSALAETTITLRPGNPKIEAKESPGRKESQKGYALFKEGKQEEALLEFQAVALKHPEDAVNHYNLGITFMALGRIKEAIGAFKKTIEFQPDNFAALKSLGQLFAKENDYEQAAHYFSLAANNSSSDPDVLYNLGVSLLNLRDYGRAREAFEKTIRCKDDFADAYYQLGLLYVGQNEKEKALTSLQKFLDISPGDARAPQVKKMMELIKK